MAKRTSESTAAAASLPLTIGMAYLNYQSVLVQLLSQSDLAAHLRPGMGNTLFALFAKDGLSIGELAAKAGLALATVSEVLKRMEKAGLVRRERSARDGRVTHVFLSDLGRGLESRCRELNAELVGIMTANLSESEADQAVQLPGRISRNFSQFVHSQTATRI